MSLLIICILIGLLPAAIAQKKGRSFVGWWIFGAALFIVALPASLIVGNLAEAEAATRHARDTAKCPYCAETIKAEAIVCKHCGRDLAAAPAFSRPLIEGTSIPRNGYRMNTDD